MRRQFLIAPALIVSAALLASCAGASDATSSAPPADSSTLSPLDSPTESESTQEFPDVEHAVLRTSGDQFTIEVTISSPYDTAERYADGWRVLSSDGTVLSEHQLGHDHANEQPFTRTSSAFSIPDGIDEVIVEGRDQTYGYGGTTVVLLVPR